MDQRESNTNHPVSVQTQNMSYGNTAATQTTGLMRIVI